MNSTSTATQLLDFYDNVFNAIDDNKQFDTIYLDFSKAFDSISHELLIHKLKSFGFNMKLLEWFRDYLKGRKQRVVIKGFESPYLTVRSGVPQGSILGPLLFLYFINDIFSCITDPGIELSLYADDSKIGKRVLNIRDCDILQTNIDNLMIWSNKWGLKFNVDKCVSVSFSTPKHVNIKFDYTMNNVTLTKVKEYVDLGMIINENLNWEPNINRCLSRANKRLGLIKRSVGYGCHRDVKLKCYTSLIRPLLEYNTVVWFCPNKKLISKVESLQRRATKYILNNPDIDYKNRLIQCNLLPLSFRRQFLDIVFAYNSMNVLNDFKIMNHVNTVNINFSNYTRHQASLDEFMLEAVQSQHDLYGKFYCKRIVKIWNEIPLAIRSLELSDLGFNTPFKRALKNWIFEVFIRKFENDDICTWILKCNCNVCRRS
jgi:hypothetical protein